jgi:hypothetical protein
MWICKEDDPRRIHKAHYAIAQTLRCCTNDSAKDLSIRLPIIIITTTITIVSMRNGLLINV